MPIEGDPTEFLTAMQADAAAFTARAAGAMEGGAELMAGRARELLSQRMHPKNTKTPSAPGQPPAAIIGSYRLHDSVEVRPGLGPGGLETEVRSELPYSLIQEYGGIAGHGSRLPARPYFEPALEQTRIAIELLLRSV